MCGDGDAALLIGNLIVGSGKHDAHVVASSLSGHRRGFHRLGHRGEFINREEVEAPFLALGHHDAIRQFIAKLGRQDQPALFIEFGFVRAQEHAWPPLPTMLNLPQLSVSPTLLHFTPLSTTFPPFLAYLSPSRPTRRTQRQTEPEMNEARDK